MKKNRLKIVSLLITVLLSWSCQEIIDVDLTQSEKKLVIEGKLLDETSFQRIKISETLNFYDTGNLEPYKDAEVSLLDSKNNLMVNFVYNNEDSSYITSTQVALSMGEEYKLQIEAKGELLEATGVILQNATLDSLYYLSNEELQAIDQPSFGEGYFMFVNGKLNNEGIEVGLELYTLNEDMYQYYVEFINLLFNDGGVFSPPPVNPTTNIKNLTNPENLPLGFIQFSSVQRRGIVIKER